MKKISGNKLLVKALKEEGVDTLFGYPGACTIDISDELYKQDFTKVILPRQEVHLSMRPMPMQDLPEKSVFALLQVVREQRTW
mgnify:CR=1 FL=1